MEIRTRVSKLNQYDLPLTWYDRLERLNPNDLIYISTNKPAEQMSIAELEALIEDKKVNAIIKQATEQLFEAIDILKGYGAEIDIDVIGIKRPDYSLTDKEGE
jgi:hypothetical protein